LGQLDYTIPHVEQPIFKELIDARRAQQPSTAVTVLDVGASYGINGALMKCDLEYEALVSIISGTNKPWTIATNVLGGFGPAARQKARAGRSPLTLGPGS
jgi:hypothetical protein